MKKNTFLIAALMLMASCFAEGVFATPLSASLSLQASATTTGGATDTQTSTDAWGVLLSPLSVSAQANAIDQTGSRINVFGSASANWAANGLSGTVNFNNYGWNFVGTGGTATLNALPNWTFSFIANGNGAFNMNYDVVGSGDTFGLWGWNISINGSDYLTLNANDPTLSGFMSADLVDGELYTVSLHNNANLSAQSGVDRIAGAMDGVFNWSIETEDRPVPEPFSLALVAIGLLALHAVKRIHS